jgi:UDP-glucose 4-epimerase
MKILITGVAGLLGSRLADWIIENQPNVEVIGIDDLSGGYKDNINSQIQFYQLNLASDINLLSNVFDKHKPDYVYHFAAYAAEGLSPFIRHYNYTNNLLSTANIVNNCINYNVKRLIFTSTMAVYGHGEGGIFHEDMRRNPIDPYGVAKAACERDIEIANEQHGLDYCIIRPHNVFGANQNIWDKYRNVLGIWMYYHMEGKPITIFGDGTQKRAFSYIDDSLEPLWNAAIRPEASKQIINLGGIHEYSINEASDILAEVLGGAEKIYLEGRHEVHTAVPTFQKSVDILGFEHKTNLKEGLEKMWVWAQNQPKRERFIWDNYEIEKGIYTFWKK